MSPDPRLSDKMNYELVKSRTTTEEWRVEGIAPNGDCSVTLFSGTDAEKRATEYFAAVLLGGTPQSYDAEREGRVFFGGLLNPDAPPPRREMALSFLRLWANSYLLKGNYWDVPQTMGAALNQVIRILESPAACGGAASSPTPACRFMQPNQTAPCSEVRPGEEATWCMACLLSHQPAAPVRPVQETP